MDNFIPHFYHVSTSYLQLILTLLFLSLPRANQSLLFLPFFNLVVFAPTKSSSIDPYKIPRCLFTVIFKHLDLTVFTVKRIYLVGPALFRKVRIPFVNPSSGKVTFYISSFKNFKILFSLINIVLNTFDHLCVLTLYFGLVFVGIVILIFNTSLFW